MTQEELSKVLASGVVFVCAMCDRFWWGMANKTDGCEAAVKGNPCAGPLGRMAYPEYKGPLEGNLHSFCFICGVPSDAGIEVLGKGIVGVCRKHLHVIDWYGPKGKRPPKLAGEVLQTKM